MNGGTIIVTGGAGYLGRCAVHLLSQSGYRPVIIDNFSSSDREVPLEAECFEADLVDYIETRKIFQNIGRIDALIHFAAKALVGESIEKPREYYSNNLNAAITVAALCDEFRVNRIIHSSSCAVYGVPVRVPILEDAALSPVSPYGESKLLSERIFDQYSRSGRMKVLQLRYFNPAGCVGLFGERHAPETHLVPRVIEALRSGSSVAVYGNDYPTPDGTCVRDYVHVLDLLEAHVRGLDWLKTSDAGMVVNLGSGRGYSVLEVIRAAEHTTGRQATIDWQSRRAGDPPILVADIRRAKTVLGWEPSLDLFQMIRDHDQFSKGRL